MKKVDPATNALIEILEANNMQVVYSDDINEVVKAVRSAGRELDVKNVPDYYEVERYNHRYDEIETFERKRFNPRKWCLVLR